MRIVFMGTPAFAVPVLAALREQPGVAIAGVYTPPDRPRGRGQELESTPVKAAALEMGLPVFQPASLRPDAIREELAARQPDVIVVAAYGKLLPPEVLALPPHGCLNIHPSLLPKYRGPSPVATAILDGVPVTGVTLMLLDEGMDTGPIIAQREYPLSGEERADPLTAALFQVGGDLLLECLEPWTAGSLPARPQDDAQATVTRKLERADGRADWRLAAAELERRHRAFTPWPGLYTQWQGKTLRLLEVAAGVAVSESGPASTEWAGAAPGRIVTLPQAETPAGVTTGQGILALKTVQLEGRRAVPAAEFLNGYPNFLGSQL